MPRRVLILSGFACRAQIWKPILPFLAPNGQPSLVDWPIDRTPAFHRLDDFSNWLAEQFPLADFDTIIGHSMGGLIAAHLLMKGSFSARQLILVESFLLPPGPFFQNLLMPDTAPSIVQAVTGMLQTERPFYSPVLQQFLRAIDLYAARALPDVPIHAIYGDRGCQQPDQVVQALGWPADLSARIPVTLIPHACHFPMLENPGRLSEVLNRLIAV